MTSRIVLIGAGSANFGLGTLGDILKSKALVGSTVILHDINPQALERVQNAARGYITEKQLPFRVESTTDRKTALQGADFCIISIEVGNRFELWDQDWHVAQQYGIRQVYGENGGPGGLFHSMRIIPPILDICADIMLICPQAWVFNFSNPMSRICTTVKRRFPDLRLVGLCHEIASLPHHLPNILETPLENIIFTAGGLNHFSVLLDVRYKDTNGDAYPDVRAKAPAYFAALPSLEEEIQHHLDPSIPLVHKTSEWAERELFKVILETFGYLPITTDSHFGEYIQWAHDVVDHKGILDFYRNYQKWCAMMVSDERISGTTEAEGWSVVPIIEAIVTGIPRHEAAVNVLNDGLINNIPPYIAVEVPAIVDSNGVRGVTLGALPAGFAGLLHNQVAVHDLTAEAILNCSRQLALQALLVDPVVHTYRAAQQTLDTMLALQPQWLGYLK
jgi:alpha-galactosidase